MSSNSASRLGFIAVDAASASLAGTAINAAT